MQRQAFVLLLVLAGCDDLGSRSGPTVSVLRLNTPSYGSHSAAPYLPGPDNRISSENTHIVAIRSQHIIPTAT